MKNIQNICCQSHKYNCSISSKKSTKKLKFPSIHLCNKNHGLLDPSQFVTLVVVVIMWNLSCITTLFWILVKFVARFTSSFHIPSVFISKILCEREDDDLFYKKQCVGGNKCDRCGNLSLFHSKYHIDMNDQSFSNITVNYKRYEYMNNTAPHSSNVISKRIDLKVEKIYVIDFLKKFEEEIYKYTKHSHRARWKYLQFKQFREVFPPGTILFVVDFAENCTFTAQNEIQSEYYHSEIFVPPYDVFNIYV
jgi:hypothetical protein